MAMPSPANWATRRQSAASDGAIDATRGLAHCLAMLIDGTTSLAGAGPAILLLLALVAEIALTAIPGMGGPVGVLLDAPRRAIGALADGFERRLNRPRRGAGALRLRGLLTLLLIAGPVTAVGFGLAFWLPGRAESWIVELALLLFFIAPGRSFFGVLALARALSDEDLPAANRRHAAMVGDATELPDAHAISRAGIELLMRALCVALIAPGAFYLLFGVPGLLLYGGVAAIAARIARPGPDRAAFGGPASAVRELLDALPAALSGVVLGIASLFAPTARPGAAFRVMLAEGAGRRPAAAYWTQGAAAGALGLALAGPRYVDGATVPGNWLGTGRARATAKDVRRALYLFAVAVLIAAALIVLMILSRTG